jgi:hypothetical protein
MSVGTKFTDNRASVYFDVLTYPIGFYYPAGDPPAYGNGASDIEWNFSYGGFGYQYLFFSGGYSGYLNYLSPPQYANGSTPLPASGFLNVTWENNSQSQADIGPAGSSDSSYLTQTHVMIQPAGQQTVGQTTLYLLQAQVINEATGLQLPAALVQFMNQLAGTTTEDVTNDDGSVWSQALVMSSAGAPVEVTPTTPGNINFSQMKLSPSKVLYISVDSNNKPSTFNSLSVQQTFQSELFSNVFYSLPAGQSVQIQVHIDSSYGGTIGWDSLKHTYVNRVVWDQAIAGGLAASPAKDGNTTIDPIACRNYNEGSDPGTQLWVNILAHETIWLNICHGFDNDLTVPAGEISSGLESPLTAPFTANPANQASIISAFGF